MRKRWCSHCSLATDVSPLVLLESRAHSTSPSPAMKALETPSSRRRKGRPKQSWNLRLNNSPISFLLVAWAAAVLTPRASAAGFSAASSSSCASTGGQPTSMSGPDITASRSTTVAPPQAAFDPSSNSSGKSRLRSPAPCGQQRHHRQRLSAFATRLRTPKLLPPTRGELAGRTAACPPLRNSAAAGRPCSLSTFSTGVPPSRPKAIMMTLPSPRRGAAAVAAAAAFWEGMGGGTRQRTFGGSGLARCAVAGNQSSGPQSGSADSAVVEPQQQEEGNDDVTNRAPRRTTIERVGGKGVSRGSGSGGDAKATPPDGGASLWEGLGSWEGLGEGLSGAFLYAQQGLEGFNILGVGDAFWVNFSQMDVPELPVLPELHIFGLTWPPPPSPPAADAAGEDEKESQSSLPMTEPARATKGAVPRTTMKAAAATETGGDAKTGAALPGGSARGAGQSAGGDGDAQTWRERLGLPRRLSALRQQRPTAAAVTGGREEKVSNASSPSSTSSRSTTTATAAAAAAAAAGEVRLNKDNQRAPGGGVADRQGPATGWPWRRLKALGGLRALRPPLNGGDPGRKEDRAGNSGGGGGATGEGSGRGGEVVRGVGVVQNGGKVSRVGAASLLPSALERATESGKASPTAHLQFAQKQQRREEDRSGTTAPAGSDRSSGRSGSSSRATLSSPSSSLPGGAKGGKKVALKTKEGQSNKPRQEIQKKKNKVTKESPSPPLALIPASDGRSSSVAAAASTAAAGKDGGKIPSRNSHNAGDDNGADGRRAAGAVVDSTSSAVDGDGGTGVGGGNGKDDPALAVGAGSAPSSPVAPTKFIPKFAPPPNAWKIISSKFPVEEQKQQPQKPFDKPTVGSTGGGSPTPGWQPGGSARSESDDGDGDNLDESDEDEFHDFGDVTLSVRKIPEPPSMEITINRSSGTPANAETRPVAAAAAKAAADSDNVLEEWVDGEPVEVHHGRTASRRQPNRPADLTATSGEMKLVEMACLTGLSCRAGKSAGRVMGEELGFGHLLRGLREDVRPSLRRRVLQAISTVVDSDPSLAPRLLGLVSDDGSDTDASEGEGETTKKSTRKNAPVSPAAGAEKKKHARGARTGVGIGRKPGRIRRRSNISSTSTTTSTATTTTTSSISGASGVTVAAVDGSGGSAWVRLLQGLAERRRRRRVRRRRVASGGAGTGAALEEGASSSFPDGDNILFGEDDLLERITTILGYHGSGTGFGAGVVPADGVGTKEKTGGGVVGPLGRAFRAMVDLLRAPRLRPFFVAARDSDVAAGGSKRVSSSVSKAKVSETAGVLKEEDEQKAEGEGAREGRDWWKDEVALEEEGLEQKAAASAGVGQGKEGGGSGWVWWWGRGRRVSRERLVEEALELTFRLVMSGDVALDALKVDKKLVAALKRVAEGGGQRLQYDSKGVLRRFGPRLTNSQLLANKCLASLGAHEWRPKMRGQKGVRILCFDGGGTRGVLTVALLKHVEKALGGRQPHEVFDMIVGTSTGGIIAGLAGVKGFPVAECERMYDSLINKIFIKHPGGGVKLALKQAFYDEVGWMKILSSILADQLMVDSAQDPLRPLIVCPSTIISSNPARVMLWRNYNYPPGHQSRYYGSFRYKVREAIRATTAAPTFFPPLMINGALYSDGALLCNNPSAVAFHEAKHVFPDVPIEMIVSIGTGCFFEEKKEFDEPALGWDGIINQVIASATETEITTDIVSDLLPKEQYFRFNPRMADMPIDEVRKERLDWLKTLADDYFEMPENQARLQEMAERVLPDSL